MVHKPKRWLLFKQLPQKPENSEGMEEMIIIECVFTMTVQALIVPVHWKWSVWPGGNCTS
jgi:hypothetical protein